MNSFPPIPLDARIKKSWTRVVVLWGILSAVAGGALSFFTTSAALATQIGSYSTDAEVDGKIKLHNDQPRTHDATKSVHPELSAAADKVDRTALDLETYKSNRRKHDIALFATLVSLQVAQWSKDPRKGAADATKARLAFKAKTNMGADPAEAMEEVLESSRPPWLR